MIITGKTTWKIIDIKTMTKKMMIVKVAKSVIMTIPMKISQMMMVHETKLQLTHTTFCMFCVGISRCRPLLCWNIKMQTITLCAGTKIWVVGMRS